MSTRAPLSETCRRCGMPLAYDRFVTGQSVTAPPDPHGLCSFCIHPGAVPITPSRSGRGEWLLDVMVDVYNATHSLRRTLAKWVLRLGPVLPEAIATPMGILDSVPRRRPGAKYDAIVLYSGGKDSSYMLLNLARRKLRLGAWMLQQGYQSPRAVENARRLCERLGVPLYIESPGKHRMDRVFRAGFDIDAGDAPDVLRAAMTYGSACGPCFTTIANGAARFCEENDPAFCFIGTQEGQNRMDPSGQPVIAPRALPTVDFMLTYALSAMRKRIEEKVPDALPEVRPGACRTVMVPFYEFVKRPPLEQQLAVLREAGWEMPNNTGACSTNCMVNELGRQVMRNRFGYDLYQIMAANERRLKLQRGEAVPDAAESDPVDAEQVARAAKMMGLTADEARRYGLGESGGTGAP